MADGEGKRWNNYMGIPKHLIEIKGEPILARTVRLLTENGIPKENIIITSRDERYNYATRIEQTVRDCEIDRFEESVIDGPICYIYGDVYYSDASIKTIVNLEVDDIHFFGSEWEIFAIKINNVQKFLDHKHLVKAEYMNNNIPRCIGWEIYRSLNGISLLTTYDEHHITDMYTYLLDETFDFDSREDYEWWINEYRSIYE